MHIPVLQKEVLQYLDPKPNENFIDATIGQGGHTLAILERILPNGKVLGIDWSEEILKDTRCIIQDTPHQSKLGTGQAKYKDRVVIVCDSFVNLKEIVKKQGFKNISGILLDLGMSSWHLEESKRGFSFLRKEPLDMRYSLQNPLTAEKILNYYSGDGIEKILREFGEERFSRKISEKIIETRKIKPIKNTFQLVEIVREAVPSHYRKGRISPCTRTFQALRIAVNNELNNLQEVLPQALEVLKEGGRMAVISFHSLEDRIVKNFFKNQARKAGAAKRTSFSSSPSLRSADEDEPLCSSPQAKEGKIKILTKKPVFPSGREVKINPRSRSAKLRAAIKICQTQ